MNDHREEWMIKLSGGAASQGALLMEAIIEDGTHGGYDATEDEIREIHKVCDDNGDFSTLSHKQKNILAEELLVSASNADRQTALAIKNAATLAAVVSKRFADSLRRAAAQLTGDDF